MNAPKTLPARFNLAAAGLSESHLKAIAGARPGDKTRGVTVAGLTMCCWE